MISGEWEVTASDGETRRLAVGSVLLVEDTHGKGHSSRVVSETDSLAAMVQLDSESRCSPLRFMLKEAPQIYPVSLEDN